MNLKTLWIFTKNVLQKTYSFLVIDTTFGSNNPLRFRKNIKIDGTRDKKLQYQVNREAAEISALLSGKIDKDEYLTGEEILPFNQREIIEQAKFSYFPLGKDFEKQTEKLVNAINCLEISNKKMNWNKLEVYFQKLWWMI